MAKAKKKEKGPSATIALNKKARFEYQLGERIEAGIVLEGWEVKSLRAGQVQFNESHITINKGEAFLLGTMISPLKTASTHVTPAPLRPKKLLLHRKELDRLIGSVERKGSTLVPTALYWKKGKAKLEIALAKGKKQHDKRATEKDRDWGRNKARIMKRG